jgi:hypothetical protein
VNNTTLLQDFDSRAAEIKVLQERIMALKMYHDGLTKVIERAN